MDKNKKQWSSNDKRYQLCYLFNKTQAVKPENFCWTLTSLPADEGPLRCFRHSLPHSDGFGVSWVCCVFLLIVTPVLVSLEEVRFPDRLPAQCRVDAVFGEAAAQLHQAVRVPRLGRNFLKHPVLITWKM